jgi:hypothetical protein
MNSWFTPLKTDSRKRSLMALLGGVAAIGIAKSASAQTSAVPLGPSVGNVSGGGGGGGSGATQVASIAALKALASSNGTALLTQANLFGTFNWNSANLSTQVTNDPGQGIYVAPASAPTGASGAWVRQYSGRADITWFGAVGDGVMVFPVPFGQPTVISGTDNSTALANWGTWARHQSALGLRVIMNVPPPTVGVSSGQTAGYLFDYSKCFIFAVGIKYLRWYNNGAMWQNINSGISTFSNSWSHNALPIRNFTTNALLSWFINQTTPGAFAFSMLNTGDASNINVGDWISLASLDVEYFGFPPTPQQFEFVKASAVTQFAAANATSVTYNSGAGLLTMTFATAPYGAAIANLIDGVAIPISGLTGSGVAALNATWPIASTSSSGTVINFNVTKGLGSLTIGGGTLAAVAIVTIEQAIRWSHRPDFPDSGNNAPVGKARVWQLNQQAPITINGLPANATWDTDHEYYNMHLGYPFVQFQSWPQSGRRFVDVDSVVGGYTESVFGEVNHVRPTILRSCEPDKWGGELTYEHTMLYAGPIAPFSPNFPLAFQSPLERVSIIGGRFNGGLTSGQIKEFRAQLADISSLGLFAGFGLANRHVFDQCVIGNSPVGLSPLALSAIDGGTLGTFDGVDAAYGSTTVTITIASPAVFTLGGGTGQPTAAPAAGTICILSNSGGALPTGFTAGVQYFVVSPSGATFELAATSGGSAINSSGSQSGTQMAGFGSGSGPGVIAVNKSTFPFGFAIGAWNAVPGMTVSLLGPGGIFTGASSNQVHGNGVVTAISEDATYYYIATTLNFATLPAWANGQIYLFHNQGAVFKDCTGSDVVRQASEAYKKGLDYWEYKKYTLGGVVSNSLSFISQVYGALTQVICTVLDPGVNANALVQLTFGSFNSASNFATDSGGTTIKFVVGLWGQRTVTQAAFTNPQTGDSVQFNGGSASAQPLPPGRVVSSVLSIGMSNFAGTTVGNPIVIIELFFDCGIIRKVIPVQYDITGANNTVFGIAGQLP